jgi:CBS domain-containing protein
MNVLKLARRPAPTIPFGSSVREAVEVMAQEKSGAVIVLQDGNPVGVVSERDVVLRGVREGLSADDTPVERIMSSPVETVTASTRTGRAIELMSAHRFRHLGVVDDDGKLVGLLSSRESFREHLAFLLDQLLSLESFICADGPGG